METNKATAPPTRAELLFAATRERAAGRAAWDCGNPSAAIRHWRAAAACERAAGAPSTTPAHLRLPEATP